MTRIDELEIQLLDAVLLPSNKYRLVKYHKRIADRQSVTNAIISKMNDTCNEVEELKNEQRFLYGLNNALAAIIGILAGHWLSESQVVQQFTSKKKRQAGNRKPKKGEGEDV